MVVGDRQKPVLVVVTSILNPTLIRTEKGQGMGFFYYLYKRVSDTMMGVLTESL